MTPSETTPGRPQPARSARATGAGGTAVLLLLAADGADAYVGPGAGFAVVGGVWTVLVLVVAALSALLLPLHLLHTAWRRRRRAGRGTARRVIVLGLDGFDPGLARRFAAEGRLPHLSALADSGAGGRLATTLPALTPSAWSTFATGVDASRHSIFDFITRDPRTYAPVLSSAQIGSPQRSLPRGPLRRRRARARVRNLRRSQPFWKVLGEHGVFSSILRVPITFPPEAFHGVLLSGMCVPDLRGTQGEFTWVTTGPESFAQGRTVRIELPAGSGHFQLSGPPDPRDRDTPLAVRVEVTLAPPGAVLRIGGDEVRLAPGRDSGWVHLDFRGGGARVRGLARFRLCSVEPFQLYVAPLQLDPERPALPLSHPAAFAPYLAARHGPFTTLGLAEDTDALNAGAVDEAAFLEQAWAIHDEREAMFFEAVDNDDDGLVVCVFDGTDRIQHMFYRTLDADHPANAGREVEAHAHVIPELYERMDRMVGRLLARCGSRPDTAVIVLSDHGFCAFRRGVNLNAWLRDHGYLYLRDDARTGGEWLGDVDWSRTRAYALGLTGLFINRAGREAQGIVAEGAELAALKAEIAAGLEGLVDPSDGQVAIRQVWDTDRHFSGPYTRDAPDLLVGYAEGYRAAWSGASGAVSAAVFEDNDRPWSGDHCVDPALVPGVLYANRPVTAADPQLADLPVTILRLFGVEPPRYMEGRDLFAAAPAAEAAG